MYVNLDNIVNGKAQGGAATTRGSKSQQRGATKGKNGSYGTNTVADSKSKGDTMSANLMSETQMTMRESILKATQMQIEINSQRSEGSSVKSD